MEYTEQEAKQEGFGTVGERLAPQEEQLQIGRQEKEVAILYETIKTLKGRLNHVLAPSETTENALAGGEANRPMRSPLAERVDANNSTISRATYELNDIIRRLEC